MDKYYEKSSGDKEISKMKKKMAKMEKKITKLQEQLMYLPGHGDGYKEAKEDFEELKEQA